MLLETVAACAPRSLVVAEEEPYNHEIFPAPNSANTISGGANVLESKRSPGD